MSEKISRPENVLPAPIHKIKWSLPKAIWSIMFVIGFVIVDSGGLIISVEEERDGIP